MNMESFEFRNNDLSSGQLKNVKTGPRTFSQNMATGISLVDIPTTVSVKNASINDFGKKPPL